MLAPAIERRFDGARCVTDGLGVRAVVSIDGAEYHAHASMLPRGSVAVELPPTDGFELSLAWTDRARSHRRPPSFDDSCLVETNDVALAHAWLDTDARNALLASRYVSCPKQGQSAGTTAVMLRDGAWRHELAKNAVRAWRADVEPSAERVADILAAALALAHRPVRWARRFAKLARELGGVAANRVEIGGKPVLRVRRGHVDVTVRIVRRLDPDESGRLRTVIGAHRLASAGETLQLISEELPRVAWPPGERSSRSPRLRLEPGARRLLDAAQPAASIVRPHDVEITFDGAIVGGERLGAAIELAARWAADSAADAPYR
ncbi:MAG TPA: hypothetical protein VH143_35185 [Kofleriaceae bacterium]|nr:hypothetical protein [Kofleriaceae bacterium]